MSLDRSLSNIESKADGGYGSPPTEPERLESFSESLEDIQAMLYPEVLPQTPAKKHSADFLNSRLKARHMAENKLTQLSDDLLKLAEAVRYCHPLMAEALDDAWDATEAAITLMSYIES